jgi:hypothetical protein
MGHDNLLSDPKDGHDDESIQCKLVLYMVHKLFVYTFFLVGLLAYIARNQTLLYVRVCIYYL